MSYSVYVMYSDFTIDNIKNSVCGIAHDTKFHVRPMNTFDHNTKKLRDNHMNLLFFEKDQSDEVIQDIGTSLNTSLTPFNWDLFKMPGQNESSNLHLRGFPRNMSKKTAVTIIENNLKFLGFTENDYKISMSLLDRASNIIRGDGTVYFSDHVPDSSRKLARVLLDKTILTHNDNRAFIFCKWQRTSNVQLPGIRNSRHRHQNSRSERKQQQPSGFQMMPLASDLHQDLQASSVESKFAED